MARPSPRAPTLFLSQGLGKGERPPVTLMPPTSLAPQLAGANSERLTGQNGHQSAITHNPSAGVSTASQATAANLLS